jgi:hypothetical protein
MSNVQSKTQGLQTLDEIFDDGEQGRKVDLCLMRMT